jgi:GNAT superfamily N-acetyltransferase
MKIDVHNRCDDFTSYRAARVKSLFNAESGANFTISAEIPDADEDWQIGVVVGPSGSGKTSIGRKIFPDAPIYEPNGWAHDKPLVDCIAPEGDFDAVTGALAAVGLGTVPSWLRPYTVLSNGEKFRADLARIICEAPARVVVDEFTSVVDRQIAKFGALAFQKAWRRTGGKCVLLSCHYDILDWVEPDWVFDTATGVLSRRRLRRPSFDLTIWQTDGRYWDAFEPHHYLKLPRMVAATYFVGCVDGEPVAHIAFSPRLDVKAMRACRMVIMPEWQGAGIGMRFLNELCRWHLDGNSRYGDRVKSILFHTSHPGLSAALRRDPHWVRVSAVLHGGNKAASKASRKRSHARTGGAAKLSGPPVSGYGGHFRAVQGFKYWTSDTELAKRLTAEAKAKPPKQRRK